MNLSEVIKEKRPNLSASSIKTYASVLKNIYKKIYNNENFNLENFNNSDKILKFLTDVPANKIKTILSALFVITENKAYRDKMMDSIQEYKDDIAKQEMTETQKDNWLNDGEMKEFFLKLKANADYLYKKKNLDLIDYQQIQNFIILALYYMISPRRSKDYVDFVIKSPDKEKDNYLEGDEFVFNSYKTAKFYGVQRIKIGKDLKAIINKWIKINPTKYLLFDSNGSQLSSVKLNQRLNKIFGKKISVNAIRHSALTSKFGDTIKLNKEIAKMTTEMGSSPNMLSTYVKNIPEDTAKKRTIKSKAI